MLVHLSGSISNVFFLFFQEAKANLEKWFKNGIKASAHQITSHSSEIDGAVRVAAQAGGIDGINVLEDFALWFGTELGQGNEAIQSAVYITTMVVLDVAQDILNVGSAAYKIDMTALTLHQIKDIVERIEKKVDKLLKEPLETAQSFLSDAITEIINDFYEESFETLQKVIDNAKKALNLVKGKNISIESFGDYIKAARLIAFSTILRHSYDRKEKVFLPKFLLSSKSENVISDKLESVVKDCLEQKENVNVKTVFVESKEKKSVVQDMLDSLLKVTYPFISQSMKWTDMRSDLSKSDGKMKITLMPKYLPHGCEDKTELDVNLTKVNVWRMKQIVLYEHNDAVFYKTIKSESAPVDMEDAESGVTVTLSATGPARLEWPDWLGDFTLTGKLHNDRAVYRHSRGGYMYSLETGAWAVGGSVGERNPAIGGTTATTSPALCPHWFYREKLSGVSKTGDIKVNVKKF